MGSGGGLQWKELGVCVFRRLGSGRGHRCLPAVEPNHKYVCMYIPARGLCKHFGYLRMISMGAYVCENGVVGSVASPNRKCRKCSINTNTQCLETCTI